MATLDPRIPVRADHRFIRKYLASLLGGKVEFVPSEFDLISIVFQKAGGSWKRLFGGSPQDVIKLKNVIETAYKKGYMTKKRKWLKDDETDQGSDGDG